MLKTERRGLTVETNDKELRERAYAEIGNALEAIGRARNLVTKLLENLTKDFTDEEPGFTGGDALSFIHINGAITMALLTLVGLRAQFKEYLLEEVGTDGKEADGEEG
jgi:hypothetical protein